MKNFLTVFALMLSMSGIAVSLAREEVRCYLGLSSSACLSTDERDSSPRKVHSSESSSRESSQTQESQKTQDKTPQNLPASQEKFTQEDKDVKEVSVPSHSSDEAANPNPSPEAEKASTETPQVSEQPSEQTKEVSASSTEVEPLTHSVELEVIPPPEDNSTHQQTQNQ